RHAVSGRYRPFRSVWPGRSVRRRRPGNGRDQRIGRSELHVRSLEMNPLELSRKLDEAFLQARDLERLTAREPFSVEEAYEIQDELLDLRYERGERQIGLKMGLTSRA